MEIAFKKAITGKSHNLKKKSVWPFDTIVRTVLLGSLMQYET